MEPDQTFLYVESVSCTLKYLVCTRERRNFWWNKALSFCITQTGQTFLTEQFFKWIYLSYTVSFQFFFKPTECKSATLRGILKAQIKKYELGMVGGWVQTSPHALLTPSLPPARASQKRNRSADQSVLSLLQLRVGIISVLHLGSDQLILIVLIN